MSTVRRGTVKSNNGKIYNYTITFNEPSKEALRNYGNTIIEIVKNLELKEKIKRDKNNEATV